MTSAEARLRSKTILRHLEKLAEIRSELTDELFEVACYHESIAQRRNKLNRIINTKFEELKILGRFLK